MTAEEILKLFDTCWFEQGIFTKKHQEKQHVFQEPKILSPPTIHVRSQSDHCIILDSSLSPFVNSPTSVIKAAESEKMKTKKGRKIKSIRIRRSSSDLELEELKGFMDLGFEFTEADKNSSLVTIIPGILQRWGDKARDDVKNSEKKDIISRPYLSEAWEILEKRKMRKKLLKWRFPKLHNEINMKDNLRFWAQTVASTFR